MLNCCRPEGILYPPALYNEQCQFYLKMETIIVIRCDVLIYLECVRVDRVKDLVLSQALTNFIMENK